MRRRRLCGSARCFFVCLLLFPERKRRKCLMRHSFLLLLFSCCSKKKEPKVFDYLGPKICDRRKFVTAETPDPKGGGKNRDEKRAENEVKNSPEKEKSVPKASKKRRATLSLVTTLSNSSATRADGRVNNQ